MGHMTDTERDAFLADPHYAVLSTLRRDGSPVSVPVWFDWDGRSVTMFTYEGSPKLGRLRSDPRATVLVANNLDEKEKWVAFDGAVTISNEGGRELGLRLAERYWDLDDPERAQTVERWSAIDSGWFLLELVPERIRTYAG